jgi:hypothetical protein
MTSAFQPEQPAPHLPVFEASEGPGASREDSAVERVFIPVSGQTQTAGLPPKYPTLARIKILPQNCRL